MSMSSISSAKLAAAIAANGVPGASLAIWHGGRAIHMVAGVTDVRTDAPVTPDTIFRLGSMTKVLTSILLMQQVEAGRLGLDRPVRAVLPDFVLADRDAAERVTPRHCLSHMGGFFGDILDGPSEEDDALAAYVALGARLEQVTPPGQAFSYCNAGFAIAGRLAEVAAGGVWDDLLTANVLAPLNMMRSGSRFSAWPDDDLATPHVAGPNATLVPLAQEPIGRAMGPAGSLAWATPGDVLMLGRALMASGSLPNGSRLLSADSVAAMRALAIAGPTPTFATGWGLGIQRFTADGGTFGHDGAIAGQNSFLRICPSQDLIVVLMCNGGDARGLFDDVIADVESMIGRPFVDPVPAWPDPAPVADAARYVGTYAVPRYTVVVTPDAEGLHACFIPSPEAGDFGAPIDVSLRRQADDFTGELFLTRLPGSRLPTQQRFGRAADGRRTLCFRGRLLPEVRT